MIVNKNAKKLFFFAKKELNPERYVNKTDDYILNKNGIGYII